MKDMVRVAQTLAIALRLIDVMEQLTLIDMYPHQTKPSVYLT